jgi:hypothetical protein
VPAAYFVMAMATYCIIFGAIVLDKGLNIATFLFVSSLVLRAVKFQLGHLREITIKSTDL